MQLMVILISEIWNLNIFTKIRRKHKKGGVGRETNDFNFIISNLNLKWNCLEYFNSGDHKYVQLVK